MTDATEPQSPPSTFSDLALHPELLAGTVMAGDCFRLDEATSERVTEAAIRKGMFDQWASPDELNRLKKQDLRARVYRWLRHPTKPKII